MLTDAVSDREPGHVRRSDVWIEVWLDMMDKSITDIIRLDIEQASQNSVYVVERVMMLMNVFCKVAPNSVHKRLGLFLTANAGD